MSSKVSLPISTGINLTRLAFLNQPSFEVDLRDVRIKFRALVLFHGLSWLTEGDE